MRSPTRGWAAASSATSRSPSGTRRRHTASSASPSSTGTPTTATERRRCSTRIPRFSRSRSTRRNCYPPDSGAATEIGAGAGVGANINVPLPPGSGVGAYEAAFERVVRSRARRPPSRTPRRRMRLRLVRLGFPRPADAPQRGVPRADAGDARRRRPPRERTARLLPRGRIRIGVRAVLWPRRARGALRGTRPASTTLPADLRGIRLPGPAAAPGSGDRRGGACRSGVLEAFCDTVVPAVDGEPTRSAGCLGARSRGARLGCRPRPRRRSRTCSATTSRRSGSADRMVRLNCARRRGDEASYELRRLRAQVDRPHPTASPRTDAIPSGPRSGIPGRSRRPPLPRSARSESRCSIRSEGGSVVSADACVIGSGAGGAVIAARLQQAGLSVVDPRAGRLHERIGPPSGGAARRGEDVPERWASSGRRPAGWECSPVARSAAARS